MSKIKITFFHENDDYQNILAFTSDDRDALESFRQVFDTEGDVWTVESYPVLMAPIFERYKAEHFKGRYLFHRCMFDTEKNDSISEVVTTDVVNMLTQNNIALLYKDHPNRYVKMFAEGIVRGTVGESVLGHEFEISHVQLDSDDVIPTAP